MDNRDLRKGGSTGSNPPGGVWNAPRGKSAVTSKSDENGNIKVDSFIVIKDATTGEVLVDQKA
jgi:hypothetical protein